MKSAFLTLRLQKKRSGQVATFFVLSFGMFMVFLAMILNAGILTRDRIKLQNTADISALVAANVQRFNLNKIGELNDAIEAAYIATEVLLANPYTASPCTMQFATCSSTGGCGVCQGYDKQMATLLVDAYLGVHATLSSQISSINTHANEKAFEYVKKTALAAPNLPIDIKRQILKHTGGSFPRPEEMVREYDRDGFQYDYGMSGDVASLKEIYKVSGSDKMPLFAPEVEMLVLLSFQWIYNVPACAGLATGADAPCFTGNAEAKIPGINLVPYRFKDSGDLTPSFITSVSYSPQYLFNQIEARAMPTGENPLQAGGAITAPASSEKVHLFDNLMGMVPFATSLNARQFMTAWAASRPFGGSPADGGYDGAKLVGIASKEIGELEHSWGIQAPQTSSDGEATHIFTERDFLH